MPKKLDLTKLRSSAIQELSAIVQRFQTLEQDNPPLDHIRWFSCMTAVEIYAVWERYAESRLVAALNHAPSHFLRENNVRGVDKIPKGLADYLIRGGSKYFDFRSTDELLDKAKKLLSAASTPFGSITRPEKEHLNTLAAIRNAIVHKSDASWSSYKRHLNKVFNIKSVPSPGEFLYSIDRRKTSPRIGAKRVLVFAHVVAQVISNTQIRG